MATHDYVIANADGATVRADINSALAAIVSNNSNASSPSTTYAYQWWFDTSTNILKLRIGIIKNLNRSIKINLSNLN